MTSTFDDADVVERRAARLGELLAATDEAQRRIPFPALRIERARRARVTLRRLAVAAAAALVLVGTLGVPPLRAWIVTNARALWNGVAGHRGPVIVQPTGAPMPPLSTIGSVTIPVTDQLVIRVNSRQRSGRLTIELTPDSVATAAVTSEAGGELVVLPGELRIMNSPDSRAGYLVRVPQHVSRIKVQLAGQATRVLPSPGPWIIEF